MVCGFMEHYDLLDVEGSIETARGFGDVSVVDERKVDQVLSELNRYGVVVAGLQETKWFGVKSTRLGRVSYCHLGGMCQRQGEVDRGVRA